MATKYYGINDKWTDDDIENVIEVTSEDGSVDSVKVNGVEYGGGGGGGDFSTATLTIKDPDETWNTVKVAVLGDPEDYGVPYISAETRGTGATDNVVTVVLYRGYALINGSGSFEGSTTVIDGDTFITGDAVLTLSGDS